MGCVNSSVIGVIEKFAFPKITCGYTNDISHLDFVTRDEDKRVPIRYYVKDINYPTVIMCHGNAEDIGGCRLEEISRLFGANICVFDYSGYGLHSERISSEKACYEDAIAVYNYLVDNKGIEPDKIIIYGRSLGTGVACHLAHYLSKNKSEFPHNLILVSPLMSAMGILTNTWTLWDSFENYLLAPEIPCSTLIIHGNKDVVVPYICGVKLSSLFPHLYDFVTLHNVGHNDISCPDYYNSINEFIKKIGNGEIIRENLYKEYNNL